jgi:hypothetical protein
VSLRITRTYAAASEGGTGKTADRPATGVPTNRKISKLRSVVTMLLSAAVTSMVT